MVIASHHIYILQRQDMSCSYTFALACINLNKQLLDDMSNAIIKYLICINNYNYDGRKLSN